MTNWPISDGFEIRNFIQFSQFFAISNINEAYDAIVSATPLDQIKTSLFLGKN